MLQKKTKGLFLEINDFSILAAVTSGPEAPLTVESMAELPADADPERLATFVRGLVDAKAKFVPAQVSVYPKSRFVRRHTVETPAKVKDPQYFIDLLNSQFKLDATKNSVAVLNATDGTGLDTDKNLANQKELLLCGALQSELDERQARLVASAIYPERLEVGTLSTIGGLMHYARQKDLKLPTLVLEITPDSSNVYIFSANQLDISRPIPYGLNSMFPVIQQELGLKDEDSARKLFYSNTFDFTEMGGVLLRKMLKELQASTGFYEVQTGQTIGQLFLPLLPKNLNWIHTSLSRSLGVEVLHPDYPAWLKSINVTPGAAVQLEGLDPRWFGVFSLMARHAPPSAEDLKEAKKKKKVIVPAWHPNLRNVEELPDIKVIRTDFLINGAAAALVLGAGGLFATQELTIGQVSGERDEHRAFIAGNNTANEAVLKLDDRFQAVSKTGEEIAAFISTPFRFSDAVAQMVELMPPTVSLRQINLSPARANPNPKNVALVFQLEGSVRAADIPEATGTVRTLATNLYQVPLFEGLLTETTPLFTIREMGPASGAGAQEGVGLNFSIEVPLRATKTATPARR